MSLRAVLLLSALGLAGACTDEGEAADPLAAPPGVEEAIALGFPTPGLIAYRAGAEALEIRGLDGGLRVHLDGDFRAVLQRDRDLVLIEQEPGAAAPTALVLDEALAVRKVIEGLPPGTYHRAGLGYLVEQGGQLRHLDARFVPYGAPIPFAGGWFAADEAYVTTVVGDDREQTVTRYDRDGQVVDRRTLGSPGLTPVEGVVTMAGGYALMTRTSGIRRVELVVDGQPTVSHDLRGDGEGTLHATGSGPVCVIRDDENGLEVVAFDGVARRSGTWSTRAPGSSPLVAMTVERLESGFLLATAVHTWDVRRDEHDVRIRGARLLDGGAIDWSKDVARSRW